MPKLKTSKSAKKRIRFTATGKAKRHSARGNHLLQNKSRKRKRNIKKNVVVHESDQARFEYLMPYGD
ncbi:MAG: 50S ribosomal protein L35 [Spirochaetia bacterium]|nr:50S ribosomal protein L35 [Spirochaetia bacterium]